MAGGSRRQAQDPLARLNRRLNDLESRINSIARSPRLPQSSQRGGTQKLISPTGETLFEFGEFTDALAEARYGLALYDGDGNIIQVVDELQRGGVYPGQSFQWGPVPSTLRTSTSSVYADIAVGDIELPVGNVLIARGRVVTPATTTAEVRIWDTAALGVGGGTNGLVVPANSDGTVTFVWLHPYTVGWDPDLLGGIASAARLRWQVRRASGAGTVTAYSPYSMYFTSSRIATSAAVGGAGTFI